MLWMMIMNHMMCLLLRCTSDVASVAVDAAPSLIAYVFGFASLQHDFSVDRVVFCLMTHATCEMNEVTVAMAAAAAAGSNIPLMFLDLSTCAADARNAVCGGGPLHPG